MATIKPELAGGFRDYLPEDQLARQKIVNIIKRTFECFGFAPYETPGLEREEVLTGGDPEFKKQIFRARLADDEENLALRFDLTVPLARVVAANTDKLQLPAKLYQIGKVWRGERQQAGRYREFTQCDVDVVGSSNLMADAEIIAAIYNALSELGLTFSIKINDRKLWANLSGQTLRIVDKIDKIGRAEVEKELAEKVDAEELKEARKLFEEEIITPDLKLVIKNAKSLGVPEEVFQISNTIVRGLGYYTGIVFEASLLNSQVGSVGSGGRYDGLVSRFSPNKIPAVGGSIGLDRLFTAMDELGLLARKITSAKILMLNFDENCRSEVQKIAAQLRQVDISTEIYLGQEDTLKGQLAYAVKKEYPVVLILGSQEKEKGTIQIKNMNANEQLEVSQGEIIDVVQKILV